MDRIKALRETRKCFGKLVTTGIVCIFQVKLMEILINSLMVRIVAISDIEDGCEYAKELSKCLELDLE